MFAVLSVTLSPFIWLYVYYRRFKGLDDPLRFKERFGKASIARPRGRVVWFHSASVGETLSLRSFVSNWHQRYPDDHLLITTTTVTAAKIVNDQFQNIALHQYIPFDVSIWVDRFFNHWKPDQAFFVDSEIWPNIINACHNRNIPLVLLNARISDRSFSRWKKFPKIAQHLLNKFKLCLAQGQETEARLKELGCKNAQTMPNLKFSVPALPINQTYLNALLSFFNGKPSWIAASTHPGEEELIFNVHSQLKQKHTDLLTIIAPRHPNRAESLVKMSEAKGLNFQTLSNVLKNMSTDIDGIIVDEIGQLGTFYNLCDIVFMGGSLIPHGGHNPIEPIHFKKPVLFGPHMHNFREVCDLLSKAGPIFIKDETDLTKKLNYFFNNPNERSKISDQLYAILMTQQQSQIQLIERLWC